MAYKSIEELVKSEKPWEYSFEKQCTTNDYDKNEPLDRYFIYKATGVKESGKAPEFKNGIEFCKESRDKYGNIPDCDGSGGDCKLVIELYEKLWCWEEGACKRNTLLKLNNKTFGENKFGGDTINSVQTSMGKLVEHLISLSSEESKLFYKKGQYWDKEKGCYKQAKPQSIIYCLELYKCDGFVQKLKETFDVLEKYVGAYHSLGNFVLVPAYFNGKRAIPTSDFWDSSLAWLKKDGFGDFKAGDFNKYINYFFLWDYVNGDDGNGKYKIQKLFESHDKIEQGIWTNVTSEEAEEFMKKAINLIERRGIFMTAMLRLKDQIGDDYNDLREKVFETNAVYSGYAEVIEEIVKWLNEKEENKKEENFYFPPNVTELLRKFNPDIFKEAK